MSQPRRTLLALLALSAACRSEQLEPPRPAEGSEPEPPSSLDASSRGDSARDGALPDAGAADGSRRPADGSAGALGGATELHRELHYALVARHGGFTGVAAIGKRLVLIARDRLRTLNRGLEDGKDVPFEATLAVPVVRGHAGNSVLLEDDALEGASRVTLAVDADTGAVANLGHDDAAPRPDDDGRDFIFGDVRLHKRWDAWHVLDASRATELWAFPSDSLPISGGAFFLHTFEGSVRALDPRSGAILWQFDVPTLAGTPSPPVAFAIDGAEVVAVEGPTQKDSAAIWLFKRVQTAEQETPVWTGTIRGTARGVPAESNAQVTAGGAKTPLTDAGTFELTLSARGSLAVQVPVFGAGVNTEPKIIDVQAGHGPYDVKNLKVELFEQSCK